jgi:hypothetical protein
VAVQRNGGAGLQQLSVQGGQDAHIVVGPCRKRRYCLMATLPKLGMPCRMLFVEESERETAMVSVAHSTHRLNSR